MMSTNNNSSPSNGDHGHHSRNSVNNSSKLASNTVVPNLLLKMLEACARHKRRHENERRESSSSSTEEERLREQKCLGELNQFAGFLPRIEATINVRETYSEEYQYYDPRWECEEERTMMGDQQLGGDQTKHLRSNDDDDDAGNLCALYRAIVRGSFCPKAVQYLFGEHSSATSEETSNTSVKNTEAKDVDLAKGILSRVFKLLQFMALDPVRMALLPLKHPPSTKTTTMPSQQQQQQQGRDAVRSYYKEEDIGSTIASLLASLQSDCLRLAAVQDLINLSNDLIAVDESRALFLPPTSSRHGDDINTTKDEQNKIQVRAFIEISAFLQTNQNDAECVSGELIHIRSRRSLLALQCGVWVALQHLIPAISNSISLSSSLGGDKALILLGSARLVLSSLSLLPKTQVLGWRYSLFDVSVHSLLTLRVKLGIVGLLHSMVSKSGFFQASGSVLSPSTVEVAVLTVEAAKSNLSRNRTTLVEGPTRDKNNKNTVTQVVRNLESDLSSLYSWAITTLLVSVVVLPDYVPSSNELWLHCFPHVIDCVSNMADTSGRNNAGDDSLSHAVLRLIRAFLLRGRETSNLKVLYLFQTRCHVRGFFLHLFALAKDSSDAISSLAISILVELLGSHYESSETSKRLVLNGETAPENYLENLCWGAVASLQDSNSNNDRMDVDDTSYVSSSIRLSNKRRRLQKVNEGADIAVVCDTSLQATFANSIADALRSACAIAKKLDVQEIRGPNIISLLSESDIGLLRCVTCVFRILCSLRSQCRSKTTFRYTDKAIASLFKCIERVCDALANLKCRSGRMQYVETHLLPLALSLVVNAGLHACQVRNHLDFLNSSAGESISHCALATVSLIGDDGYAQFEENAGERVYSDCYRISSVIDMVARPDSNCLCRLDLDDHSIFSEGSISLQCRCILLAAMFPVALDSQHYEPTLSSFSCVLENVSKHRQPSTLTNTMLVMLPTLFLSLATRQSGSRPSSAKNLVSLIESFNFGDNLIRHTFSGNHADECAAYLSLARFARMHTAASKAILEEKSCASDNLLHQLNISTHWRKRHSSAFEEFLAFANKQSLHPILGSLVFESEGKHAFRLARNEQAHLQFAKVVYLQTVLALAPSSLLRTSGSHEFLRDKRHRRVIDEVAQVIGGQSRDESVLSQVPPPIWFLIIPFACHDARTKALALRNFGRLLFANGGALFLAYFAPKETTITLAQLPYSDATIAVDMLFCEIEYLLIRFCGISRDLLFSLVFEGGHQHNSSTTPVSDASISVLLLQSLCESLSMNSTAACFIFQRSLLSLVRIWVVSSVCSCSKRTSNVELTASSALSCAALDAIHAIFDWHGENALVQANICMSKIFSEFFLPSIEYESLGAMRYQLLATFIHTFLLPSLRNQSSIQNASNVVRIMEFLDNVYPSVIVKMIEDEDHDGIQMCTAFRMYLLAEHRNYEKEEAKSRKKNTHELVVGIRFGKIRTSLSRSLVPGMSISTKKLTENAKLLCSKVEVLKEVLPRLLLHSSRSSLHFFMTKVCQSEVNISDFLREKVGQHVLKTLVWELGADDPDEDDVEEMCYGSFADKRRRRKDALLALTKGFLLKEDENSAEIKQLLMSPSDESEELTLCTSTAGKWIAPNFMYLLVNVVVYKWGMRSEQEKFQAIKCLRSILQFLPPADSPQYIPQIMAAINNVMSLPSVDGEARNKQLCRLRLVAVLALFDFIKIVASHDSSRVGENLTLIVVTLFPLFDDNISINDEAFTSRRKGAQMLEWLAKRDDILPYFREVPFLPFTEDLKDIRSILLQKGINIDDVRLLSQHTGSSDDVEDATELQSKFYARMNLLLHLVTSHENKNVRKVVIQHMTNLIKANRDLFHSLVVNEELASMHFLTVVYNSSSDNDRVSMEDPVDLAESKVNGGLVTKLLARLLTRCVDETDQTIRNEIAKLFGEIGAIDPNKLGREINSSTFFTNSAGNNHSDEWRLANPPWQTTVTEYQLRLVTKHFVSGLKSAPSTLDQHKVSFGIQELLKILHREMGGVNEREMAPLLKEKLDQADVSNIVEPFWSTNYMQADTTALKPPPFFNKSSSYFVWLSQFSKYMLTRSHSNRNSVWKDLFYACRSAIRSQAGVDVAEFIFPLLILDGVCFGDKHDEDAITSEILDALSFEDDKGVMKLREREKAANLVFTLLDVLKYWLEQETELEHKPTKGRSKRGSRPSSPMSGSSWPMDASIKRIERLLARIPLSLCAVAASNVGMHARALQYLEMDGRSKVSLAAVGNSIDQSKEVFKFLNSQFLDGIDLQLAQNMLGQLNDFDTMIFVAQKSHKSDLTRILAEDAAAREMYEDWEGSFQAYERLLDSRLSNENGESNVAAQKGLLRSLLKLGRLDSVLNQAYGMSNQSLPLCKTSNISNDLLPSAVEAAWRLGKWSVLDNLVNESSDESSFDPGARYQIEFGRTLHGLHAGSTADVITSLTAARESVMSSLSGAARVSYTRSYPFLLQLHALREVEEFSLSLGKDEKLQQSLGDIVSSSEWKDRLDITIADATGSNAIINTRLAISRMVNDPRTEGAMWLEVGKLARKGLLYQVAEHSLAQADVSFSKCLVTELLTSESMGKLKLQFAKLKHAIGESTTALKIIEDDIPTKIFLMNASELQSFFSNETSESEEDFGRRILQATEWIVCGGLRGSAEIKNRYQTVLKLVPNWERAHFHFAKYLDSRLSEVGPMQGTENDNDGTGTIASNSNRLRHEYLIDSVKHYGVALTLGEKHVYQALPRMLAMWLEFTSQTCNAENQGLYESQEEVNKIINSFASEIPEHLFYTALPQLISSVVHASEKTSKNVALILTNVLARYPGQAMWSCGWLRFSKDEKKKLAGDDIFASAIKKLRKASNGRQMEGVLGTSKNIFNFFINLAEFTPKGTQNSVKMKVPSFGVKLTTFIPPIQAALVVSPGVLEGSATDAFPTFVPRMRAFDNELKIMQSKAKPKKVKVFAVSLRMAQCPSLSDVAEATDEDVGEMHFLVKKEAKGDLRKDSRVQDFNNVINRLFSCRGSSGPNRRQRLRLQLRTFSVVCLAEDSGILEWVPNTESLRSVITDTYNPQVDPTSIHRRGIRLTNFNDENMRQTFLKCQDLYFKKGNLSLATKKFDELMLQNFRPLMYWWFIQKFSSPHAWFEARTNFTLSTAVWSAVGHIIGLGDRHSENILIDTRSGECVHVDFDCIFDKGLLLPRPEIIPFRLTPNMVDALGPCGVDGMYTGALVESMNTLRKNKDTLLSVLEPFLKDPVINLKSSKGSQKSIVVNSAKDSIAKIGGRLDGVYNLKNPNKKKVKRQDGYADTDDDHVNTTQLSVEGQVQKMIMEATSHENLVQVYIGWMPWI